MLKNFNKNKALRRAVPLAVLRGGVTQLLMKLKASKAFEFVENPIQLPYHGRR